VTSQERTVDRLRRILVLVPWVMANPGATLDELCARFGTTREELVADLEMVFCCGLPPFGPGDLINVSMENDHVEIDTADYLARPARLTRSEAIALLVMGRAIAAVPGFEEAPSLRAALTKLERAVLPSDAPAARDVVGRIEVELSSAGAELLGGLRAATDERARLHVTYYSQGRAELTERDLDPLLLFAAQGNWYLAAFDHASGEERNFRVDRLQRWRRTGETFERPEGFDAARYGERALFTPSARDVEAAVDVSAAAGWVREFVPHDREESLADGWTRVYLRTPHLQWLVRLLLSAGSSARAAAPPELADAVRAAARSALDRYAR
jgi:proteasome accessory factor C